MNTHLRTLRGGLAVLAATASLAGCDLFTGSDSLKQPNTLVVCETNTATLCATWQRSDNEYLATWQQGSHAEIKVESFTRSRITFVRDDPSGTSVGMHAVYEGVPVDRQVNNGTVTWSRNGEIVTGSWTAQW